MSRRPIHVVHERPLRTVLVHGGPRALGLALSNLLASDGAVRVVVSGAGMGEPALAPANLRISDDAIAALLGIEPVDTVVLLGPRVRVGSSPAAESQIGAMLDLVPLLADHSRRLAPDVRARFRIIQMSSDRVFGGLPLDTGAFDADAPYAPTSLGGAAQASADLILAAAAAEHGLPVMIAHHGALYDEALTLGGLWPVVESAVARAAVPLSGSGAVERDWLHVADLAEAIVAMIWHGVPGGRYAIGAGEILSERAIAQIICDLADRLDPPIDGQPRRRLIGFTPIMCGRDLRRALDPTRSEAALGWRPRHTIEATLLAAIDHMLNARRAVSADLG